jgi:hypothetical protein
MLRLNRFEIQKKKNVKPVKIYFPLSPVFIEREKGGHSKM